MSYATLAEARDEGITTTRYGADVASDARVQRLLDEASERIDAVTGWWFRPRAQTWVFDGSGLADLWLPAPIITLTSVTLNGAELPLDQVLQYGTVASGEHLRAPRLRRVASTDLAAWGIGGTSIGGPGFIVQQPAVGQVWTRGQQNVSVVASLGITKANGTSPPTDIRDVCLRLVMRNLARLTDAAGQSARRSAEVVRETTDGHSYELGGTLPGAAGAWRRGGLTGDADIDVVLAGYRRPSRGAIVGGAR